MADLGSEVPPRRLAQFSSSDGAKGCNMEAEGGQRGATGSKIGLKGWPMDSEGHLGGTKWMPKGAQRKVKIAQVRTSGHQMEAKGWPKRSISLPKASKIEVASIEMASQIDAKMDAAKTMRISEQIT